MGQSDGTRYRLHRRHWAAPLLRDAARSLLEQALPAVSVSAYSAILRWELRHEPCCDRLEMAADHAMEAALNSYAAAIATARRERLMQNLPGDEVERIFALGFALEQVHQNVIDLARCVSEFAQPTGVAIGKVDASANQSPPPR